MASERVFLRKQATRRRIVEAAMKLFLSQGFEQTSVAQISEAADIGKGTFFTYFPTKQDVLSFLGQQVLDVMKAADNPECSAPDRLRAIFSAAGNWFDENEAAARQMCIARISTFGQAEVPSSRTPLMDLLATVFAAGVTNGEFRDIDPEAALTLVISAYAVPVAQWTWANPGSLLAPRLAAQLDLVLTALVRK
ncbi:TetR/AcrR family transcriptional regulator [Trueperella pyogenes]|uniref:TetR/AcrR family transcriptional regulator n=1 Tax=Trueperella pyogenes TaxID=1661 RepID=UPI0032438E82